MLEQLVSFTPSKVEYLGQAQNLSGHQTFKGRHSAESLELVFWHYWPQASLITHAILGKNGCGINMPVQQSQSQIVVLRVHRGAQQSKEIKWQAFTTHHQTRITYHLCSEVIELHCEPAGFNWEEIAPKQKQRQSLCVWFVDMPEQGSGCLIVAGRLHAQSLTLIDETQVPWVTRPGTVNHLQKSMKANYRCSHMTNTSMSTDIQVNYANFNGLEKESRGTEQIKSHNKRTAYTVNDVQYRRHTAERMSCSHFDIQSNFSLSISNPLL